MHYQALPAPKLRPELSCLSDLPKPPRQLYYAGTWNPKIFHSCVAIIGSRRMTEYGRQVIEKIVPKLVFEKKTIISGFMYGVDRYAHEVCLENGGKTIAVLGWGITEKLEAADQKLADAIVKNGGILLSEWKDQKPALWTFPIRNRIVAALSADVIVVEAALKSGSLITARIAQELKRNLWAVPGPITSKTSEGTNGLIAQGAAKMWIGESFQSGTYANPLVQIVESEPLTVNDIARKLEKSVSEVGAQLSMLTLTGEIMERGGKYYARQN